MTKVNLLGQNMHIKINKSCPISIKVIKKSFKIKFIKVINKFINSIKVFQNKVYKSH